MTAHESKVLDLIAAFSWRMTQLRCLGCGLVYEGAFNQEHLEHQTEQPKDTAIFCPRCKSNQIVNSSN